ncbi:hypothetical protein [Pseudomonas sp. ESBL1]|uniref:hypothetical protein n=1 Tax=Pseudomonas sp. ESBL1 TaxID=3077324 RepID=UPI002FCA5A95
MPWYRSGTVAITAGQTTVTGTGTNFSANGRVGDAFLGPDGNWYEVTNIASATVLSILPAYKGATVSGGSYAITPIQGYDKSLRDAISSILQQWGSTLASLGDVSTENVVPVTKGGTGGTTQAAARTGLGLKSASMADILGTVSQSGGVPTGAIIERGSNANGEYVRYADGTQICSIVMPTTSHNVSTAVGALYSSDAQTWTFPVAFSGIPAVFGMIGRGAVDPYKTFYSTYTRSATQHSYFIVCTTSSSGVGLQGSLVAIGRWF